MGRDGRLLVAALVATLTAANFVRIDSASHSASDTLLNWVPETAVLLVLGVVLVAVAERVRSRNRLR